MGKSYLFLIACISVLFCFKVIISSLFNRELVYGPIPKEPLEKMYPQFARPKSAIKSLLVLLNFVSTLSITKNNVM